MSTTARALRRFERESHQYRFLETFIVIFVVILLISNLVGAKIIALGSMRFGGAQILFPFTYIFGDIFTEVYGYAGSRRAIWLGFFASILMALICAAIVALPPAPEFSEQHAYEVVLGVVPRMVAASLIAYLCGEFVNSFTLAKMKILTRGRHLWTRTVGSTVTGQFVDSIVFMFVAFLGKESLGTILTLIWSGYLFKVVYEVAMTPLTYWIVNSLKRLEGVDVFDVDTNFSPFASGTEGAAFVPLGEDFTKPALEPAVD
ncbi:MAG: queuosine precursor transporter [Bryobacteraceae bacterium]